MLVPAGGAEPAGGAPGAGEDVGACGAGGAGAAASVEELDVSQSSYVPNSGVGSSGRGASLTTNELGCRA